MRDTNSPWEKAQAPGGSSSKSPVLCYPCRGTNSSKRNKLNEAPVSWPLTKSAGQWARMEVGRRTAHGRPSDPSSPSPLCLICWSLKKVSGTFQLFHRGKSKSPVYFPIPGKKNKVTISLYTITTHSRGRHWSWWTKRLERKELTGGADGVGTGSSLETAQMSGRAAQDCQPKEAERDPEAPRTDGPARARGERNGHHNHNISNSSGAFQFSRLIQIHYLIGISQLLWTVDGQGL